MRNNYYQSVVWFDKDVNYCFRIAWFKFTGYKPFFAFWIVLFHYRFNLDIYYYIKGEQCQEQKEVKIKIN
jgi:hypothetical protein